MDQLQARLADEMEKVNILHAQLRENLQTIQSLRNEVAYLTNQLRSVQDGADTTGEDHDGSEGNAEPEAEQV